VSETQYLHEAFCLVTGAFDESKILKDFIQWAGWLVCMQSIAKTAKENRKLSTRRDS
jgi:hypothetical protein